jgi:cysteine desulfurase
MPEFALSMSSACTSTADKPSHVLMQLGLNAKQAASTLRISFGCFTKEEDVQKLVKSLVRNISLLRNIHKG